MTFSGDIEADTKALRDMKPHGKGADIYVDFSPFQAGGATHPLACISALKNGGIAMLCGDVQYELSISYGELMFKNLTIRGCLGSPRLAPSQGQLPCKKIKSDRAT